MIDLYHYSDGKSLLTIALHGPSNLANLLANFCGDRTLARPTL
ncbi:MAG: hypothetical protein ACBR20_21855 [Microcoleus sp.]